MRRRRQRGIALVLVTWVFMILGVIALDFSRYMRDDATAALNLAEETRGYYVAVAGMNRTIYDLERDRDEFGDEREPGAGRRAGMEDEEDPQDDDEEGTEGEGPQAAEADFDEGLSLADGAWREATFGTARYGVRVIDEGGLVSLRMADEALLRHVVKNLLGVGGAQGIDRRSEATVATIVDSILDWADPDELERTHGAESAFYRAGEAGYRAKNAWFDSPEELLLVRGVTAAVFFGGDGVPGLRDVLSPYGKGEKVNVRTAPPAVLQALLGIDAERAAEVVELRDEEDAASFFARVQSELRALDPVIAETKLGAGGPNIVRVEARGDLAGPRNQARVAAVIELSSELTEGVRVVRWFDRAPWEGGLPSSSRDGPA